MVSPETHSGHRIVLQKFNDVLIVPLPNLVDDGFFQELNQQLLVCLHNDQVSGVVLDLGSVDIMDQHDFEHLHRIWQSTHLMGTPLILASLNPGVAAAWAALDVEDAWATGALSVGQAMNLLPEQRS